MDDVKKEVNGTVPGNEGANPQEEQLKNLKQELQSLYSAIRENYPDKEMFGKLVSESAIEILEEKKDLEYSEAHLIGFGTFLMNADRGAEEITEEDIQAWKEHPCSNASDTPQGDDEAGSGQNGGLELVDQEQKGDEGDSEAESKVSE